MLVALAEWEDVWSLVLVALRFRWVVVLSRVAKSVPVWRALARLRAAPWMVCVGNVAAVLRRCPHWPFPALMSGGPRLGSYNAQALLGIRAMPKLRISSMTHSPHAACYHIAARHLQVEELYLGASEFGNHSIREIVRCASGCEWPMLRTLRFSDDAHGTLVPLGLLGAPLLEHVVLRVVVLSDAQLERYLGLLPRTLKTLYLSIANKPIIFAHPFRGVRHLLPPQCEVSMRVCGVVWSGEKRP